MHSCFQVNNFCVLHNYPCRLFLFRIHPLFDYGLISFHIHKIGFYRPFFSCSQVLLTCVIIFLSFVSEKDFGDLIWSPKASSLFYLGTLANIEVSCVSKLAMVKKNVLYASLRLLSKFSCDVWAFTWQQSNGTSCRHHLLGIWIYWTTNKHRHYCVYSVKTCRAWIFPADDSIIWIGGVHECSFFKCVSVIRRYNRGSYYCTCLLTPEGKAGKC